MLYFVKHDPRVSWKAKLVAFITLAYALSPIDLIPDFIPILGFLDDLLIIPLGIYLTIKLIPKDIWDECISRAAIAINKGESLPKNWGFAVIIVLLWLFILGIVGRWLWNSYLI